MRNIGDSQFDKAGRQGRGEGETEGVPRSEIQIESRQAGETFLSHGDRNKEGTVLKNDVRSRRVLDLK